MEAIPGRHRIPYLKNVLIPVTVSMKRKEGLQGLIPGLFIPPIAEKHLQELSAITIQLTALLFSTANMVSKFRATVTVQVKFPTPLTVETAGPPQATATLSGRHVFQIKIP